jgi:hypothetical protein
MCVMAFFCVFEQCRKGGESRWWSQQVVSPSAWWDGSEVDRWMLQIDATQRDAMDGGLVSLSFGISKSCLDSPFRRCTLEGEGRWAQLEGPTVRGLK